MPAASRPRRQPSAGGRPPRSGPKPAEPERPGLATRRVAARLLAAVVEARTSLDGLTDRSGGHPEFRKLDGRDQALAKAILLAALRRRGTIEAVLGACLEKPLPAGATALRHILHVGAAQILFLDVPDSAAVDLAVAHAHADPRTDRFAGLVNAILRRVAREGEALVAGHASDPLVDLPDWLRARLVAAYGEAATRRMAALFRVPAPLDLTPRDPASGEELAGRVGGTLLPTGTVRIATQDGPVTDLPGFAEGQWWVQDAAAALPVRLMGEVRGRRVADLCAAPGGKTAQLASAGGSVTALEISATRLRRLRGNLQRLGLEAETVETDLAAFRPETPFEAVLLDTPCSSTGTLRRHPDVGWTKSAAEVEKLAGVQARLLRAASELVAPGGILVFSNCSLDPAEGEAVAEAFLRDNAEFETVPVAADEVPGLGEAVDDAGWLRTRPDMLADPDPAQSGLDGFFAARFRRRS